MQIKLRSYDRRMIITFIVTIIIMSIFHFLPPLNYLGYSYTRNNNPHKPELISMTYMYVFYIIIPCILLGILLVLENFTLRNVSLIIFAYLVTHSSITCTCEVLKILVGEKRPDFLSRCKPEKGECTGIEKEITEGKKSFPSGHSATAFGGSLFLILVMHSFVYKNAFRRSVRFSLTIFTGLVLLVIAGYVGYTRINDNRHFLHDVIGGALIGSFHALFNYFPLKKEVRREENVQQSNAV